VDSALKAAARRYRCRQHAGEFTVKRFCDARLTLQPMNASWSPIYPDPELDIFGEVTHIIHPPEGDVLMLARL
jgi:DNA polymerase V